MPLPAPADVLMPVVVGGLDTRPRRTPPPGRRGRPAGVLVLVYPGDDGEARVVLTERAARDGHHSGEVSFPGGSRGGRRMPISWRPPCARRPRRSALDVVAADVRVVGLLERFWIPVSDFDVTPVVALAHRRPVLAAVSRRGRPHRGAACRACSCPGPRSRSSSGRSASWPLRYGSYDVDGLSVWGATARILSQLGAVLAD